MSSKDYDVVQPQSQSKLRACCNFFYDSKDGTVLGRNAGSWGRITLFYIIYYGFLAGFFAMWLAIFVETLDYYEPRFHGEGSILGSTPGMNFRPHPDFKKNLIWFNSARPFTYKPYVDSIDGFLKNYRPDRAPYTGVTCRNHTNPESGKVCNFDANVMFKDLPECFLEKDYGYSRGRPCVVVFINKVYDWYPEQYDNVYAPPPRILELQGRYDRNYIGVLCEGLHATDTEHIGEVKYRPEKGFDKAFYPYKTVSGYLQPLVMVQFKNVHRNVLVNVVCKMYARNVRHDVLEQVGLTKFEIMID